MPNYEAVIPIRSSGSVTPPGETAELSRKDAEIFLHRGFVKETEQSGDNADELSVSSDAGREALVDAGYDTDDKVRAATDDELLALDGVGAKTLEKIREAVPADA
jgi:hypothetical protein